MIQKISPVRRWKQWLALPLVAVVVVIAASGRTAAQGGPVPKSQPAAKLQGSPPPPPPPKLAVEQAPATPEHVYTYVEKMPQLPGGGNNAAIVENIQRNIVYPTVAPANRKEGRVFVSFTVRKDGRVQDAKIIKGLAAEYDAAVVAAVLQLPQFIPGTQNNKAVAVSFTVPVTFETQDK